MPVITNRKASQCGLTLVETLIAFAILFVMTTAILQLYAMSVSVNLGSLARTDLAYKCERVVETVRWVQALKKDALNRQVPAPTYLAGYGIDPTSTATVVLTEGRDANDAYWGRGGANVIEANPRYTLSYSVVPNGAFYTVTVEARPKTAGALRYIGAGVTSKVVRYVAQIPQ